MAFDSGARINDPVSSPCTGSFMLSKKFEEKIQQLRQELNQLANRLIQRSPEGQRIAGSIEAYEAVVVVLKTPGQESPHEGP